LLRTQSRMRQGQLHIIERLDDVAAEE